MQLQHLVTFLQTVILNSKQAYTNATYVYHFCTRGWHINWTSSKLDHYTMCVPSILFSSSLQVDMHVLLIWWFFFFFYPNNVTFTHIMNPLTYSTKGKTSFYLLKEKLIHTIFITQQKKIHKCKCSFLIIINYIIILFGSALMFFGKLLIFQRAFSEKLSHFLMFGNNLENGLENVF